MRVWSSQWNLRVSSTLKLTLIFMKAKEIDYNNRKIIHKIWRPLNLHKTTEGINTLLF